MSILCRTLDKSLCVISILCITLDEALRVMSLLCRTIDNDLCVISILYRTVEMREGFFAFSTNRWGSVRNEGGTPDIFWLRGSPI